MQFASHVIPPPLPPPPQVLTDAAAAAADADGREEEEEGAASCTTLAGKQINTHTHTTKLANTLANTQTACLSVIKP